MVHERSGHRKLDGLLLVDGRFRRGKGKTLGTVVAQEELRGSVVPRIRQHQQQLQLQGESLDVNFRICCLFFKPKNEEYVDLGKKLC